MIKISQLTVIYPSIPFNVVANRGIDLEIEDAGLLIITGPNGSGKSSLFKILSGEMSPAAGQFYIDGELIPKTEVADRFSSLFSYSAQDLSLNPRLSGRQHLRAIRGLDASKLPEILDSLSIQDEWTIPVLELSRDKRQLVGLTLSLLSPKRNLILDEPTKYLNEDDRLRLLKLLQRLSIGRSVLIATHEPSWSSLENRSIHLQDGMVVQVEGKNIVERFGWSFTGQIIRPTTLSTLAKHPNISIYQDLSTFNEALASAQREYLVFDPEARTFDQITPSELFSYHQIELPANLIAHSSKRIGSFSGGERNWIYLLFLLSQKPKQLFLLYPSLNLDQPTYQKLHQLVTELADTGSFISIFDGN